MAAPAEPPPSTAPAGWTSHDPRGIIVVPLATPAPDPHRAP
jgi:hypothetical protein